MASLASDYPMTDPRVMLIADAVMVRGTSDAAKAATLPTSCRVAARPSIVRPTMSSIAWRPSNPREGSRVSRPSAA